MGNFEILEHPADVRVKVKGEDLGEILKQAVLGMMAITKGEVKSKKCWQSQNFLRRRRTKLKVKRERIIRAEGTDRESLLVNFLTEVWYEAEKNKESYSQVAIEKVEEKEGQLQVGAKLSGQLVEKFALEIKAVTYWDLKVEEKEGGLEAIITFDI